MESGAPPRRNPAGGLGCTAPGEPSLPRAARPAGFGLAHAPCSPRQPIPRSLHICLLLLFFLWSPLAGTHTFPSAPPWTDGARELCHLLWVKVAYDAITYSTGVTQPSVKAHGEIK